MARMRCRKQSRSGVERVGGGGLAVRDDGSGSQARVGGRQHVGRSRRGSDGRRRTVASSGVRPAPTRGAGELRDADPGRRTMSGPAPRPEILTIHPYVAGEAELPGANRTLKLSSNEGAFGVPPSARAAIAEAACGMPTATPTAVPPGCVRRWASVGASIRSGSSAVPAQTTYFTNFACPMAVRGATSSCRRTGSRSTRSLGHMRAAG